MPPWLRACDDIRDQGWGDQWAGRVVQEDDIHLAVVRAYDVAFGADGYLVDMYGWTVTLLADHEHNPPSLTRHLPAHVPDGANSTTPPTRSSTGRLISTSMYETCCTSKPRPLRACS
ncbi:hypothetical protein [Actinophytocola glycyrrhizae]|uniref:Uncharacterized protein n=1 Tax=Actinophytocola glycyrrhizae TaxID=2044873 RepID=A0ABV9RWY3_9PSEU